MKSKLLQIRIEKDLLTEVQNLAKSNAISTSAQVRMLIKQAIKKENE